MIEPRLAMLVAAGLLLGAPSDAQSLQKRLEKKLSSPWIKNGSWQSDFAKAKLAARKSGKQIFAYFTRSYSP